MTLRKLTDQVIVQFLREKGVSEKLIQQELDNAHVLFTGEDVPVPDQDLLEIEQHIRSALETMSQLPESSRELLMREAERKMAKSYTGN
jgi:hypothetical protein